MKMLSENKTKIEEIIEKNDPIGFLFGMLKEEAKVKALINKIKHPIQKNYLESKLEEYLGQNKEEKEDALAKVIRGTHNENLIRKIINLGMITIAYRMLLEKKKPEDIIIDYGDMFKGDRSKELELLIENHIIRKGLFENTKDMEYTLKIKRKLETIKKKLENYDKDGIKKSLENAIDSLDEYYKYSKDNLKHGTLKLGHHQLFPAFKLKDKEALLLQYATSAGKTYASMQAIKTILQHNPDAKIMITTPMQAISEGTWNKNSIRDFGIDAKVAVTNNGKSSIDEIKNADVLIVNYDKLPSSRKYFDVIKKFAEDCNLVIIDESQEIKKPDGKSSSSLQSLLEVNKPKRLVLTATPVYNNEKDIGMILYLSNPERFRHFGNGKKKVNFNYTNIGQIVSLIEVMEDYWWEFGREATRKFHNLPKLIEKKIYVEMEKEDQDKYFKIYTDIILSEKPDRLLAKAVELEKATIYALINSDGFREKIKDYISKGYVVNIFSRLKDGIFSRLDEIFDGIADKQRIEKIHGDVPYDENNNERKRIQERLKDGAIDILINQWDCSGEAFAETAGKRKVVVIPLIYPYVPGKTIQIPGRSHRPGQQEDVEFLTMIPQSNDLKKRIEDYIMSLVKERGVRKRDNWEGTNLAEDAWEMCHIKMNNFEEIKKLHAKLSDKNARAEEILTVEDWAKKARERFAKIGVFRQRRSIIQTGRGRRHEFGDFISGARSLIGKSYKPENLNDNVVKAYERPDIILTKSGEINLALSSLVSTLKKGNEQWLIGDYGCCTGVFAQARLVVNTLENIVNGRRTIDKVINIDGNANALDYGKKCFNEKTWLAYVKEIPRMEPKIRSKVYEKISEPNYYNGFLNGLSYTKGNLIKPLVEDSTLDCVVLSQTLQYNDQKRDRDIEKIALNINRALKDDGYLIVYLIGNCLSKKTLTKASDFRNLCKLLETYNFEITEKGVLRRDFQNAYLNKLAKITTPSHYIVARKAGNCEGLIRKGYEGFAIYEGTKQIISGGKEKI